MEIPAGFFNVSFNKAMAFGYKTDDVDEFVTRALHVAKELQEENETLQQKLEVLASNLENYREEEDSLRSALIGAQKLGDSILKDSRQKAEKIIHDAEAHAAQITSEATTAIDRQRYELEQVQAETTAFKERLFSLYKTHLDIIKSIPSDYDSNRKPRVKPPAPAQPVPEPPAEREPENESAEYPHTDEMPDHGGYADQSSTDYTHDYEQSAQYDDTAAVGFSTDEPEQTAGGGEEPQEDYFESPFIIEAPDSDKPFIMQQTYDEPEAPPTKTTVEAASFERDDTSVYNIPPRRTQETASPFTTPPMVQLEFDTGDYDEYEDDEFAAEKKLLREANLNRIPYLDDDDDDDFAVQLTSKKRPIVSQKFGELKFGDSFNLRDD